MRSGRGDWPAELAPAVCRRFSGSRGLHHILPSRVGLRQRIETREEFVVGWLACREHDAIEKRLFRHRAGRFQHEIRAGLALGSGGAFDQSSKLWLDLQVQRCAERLTVHDILARVCQQAVMTLSLHFNTPSGLGQRPPRHARCLRAFQSVMPVGPLSTVSKNTLNV